MSGSAGRKWLMGCGCGCLVLLLLVVVFFGSIALWGKRTVDRMEHAVEAREQLEESLGDPRDFTPAPDGSVPTERMEAFLTIREAQAEARQSIASFFESLPMTEEEAQELEHASSGEKFRTVFSMVTGAFGMAGDFGRFFETRNRALLEHEMSLGEYSYIYTLAYHVWLGKSPDEEPGGSEKVEIDLVRGSRARIHELLLDHLRNQLEGLDAGADPAWRERLQWEIEAMEDDRRHLPWQDELPESIEASLRPYRERLEANYSAATNTLELARNIKQGPASYTAE